MIAFFSLAEFATENALWVILALAVIIIILIVAISSARKKKSRQKLTQVEETKHERYSLDAAPVNKYDDSANATYTKGDIIVAKGQTVVAGKNGNIKAGKYTVLTSIEGVEAFNVRINGFVREIQHNSTVVLGEGDSFCPVSHSVVLR